ASRHAAPLSHDRRCSAGWPKCTELHGSSCARWSGVPPAEVAATITISQPFAPRDHSSPACMLRIVGGTAMAGANRINGGMERGVGPLGHGEPEGGGGLGGT